MEQSSGMSARASVHSVILMAFCFAGCIDYFAEPPELGALPDGEASDVEEAGTGTPDQSLLDSTLLADGSVDAEGPGSDQGTSADMCFPLTETCNGVDDDCDGRIDESTEDVLCAVPEMNAEVTQRACQDGQCITVCRPGHHDIDMVDRNGCEYPCEQREFDGEAREDCNGRDDDCDGAVDEVMDLVPPAASIQAGVCLGSEQVCSGGEWREPAVEGVAGWEPDETRCDGIDSDCDGRIDETGCDVGCDGVDDDGDGRSDEGCSIVVCGEERQGRPTVPPCNACPDGTAVPEGWVCVPAGAFVMGSSDDEVDRREDEGPQWPVEITRPFLMKSTEVTIGEWEALIGGNPTFNRGCRRDDPQDNDDCPIEDVTWFDAVGFANELSGVEGLEHCYAPEGCEREPGQQRHCASVQKVGPECSGYRLPTEAEWEYAARAGTRTRFWVGDDEDDLHMVDWCDNGFPRPVALKAPNPWGLYDVHGNVSEWTSNSYEPYPREPPVDPVADPTAGSSVRHVARGGSYGSPVESARAASRDFQHRNDRLTTLGFRPVRTIVHP